jgi:hypothetical protein
MSSARFRLSARDAAVLAACALTAIPVLAAPAQAAKKKYPTITSVRPLDAKVGDTLTITGKNFRKGKNKNSVVFRRDGAKAVFVPADLATTKLLRVKLPKRLEEFMVVRDGQLQPTKFRVRILAQRLGKSFTSLAKSPTIGPEPLPGQPGSPGTPEAPKPDPATLADGDCDGDNILNGADTDDDNDAVSDDTETKIGTKKCVFDSDEDGIPDGYEYRSAIDFNDDDYQLPNESLPYPDQRPYPNALAKDADVDHDGDSLTQIEEYRLWQAYGHPERGVDTTAVPALYYSAGLRYSLSAPNANGRMSLVSASDYASTSLAGGGISGNPEYKAQIGDFLAWAASKGYDDVRLDGAVFGGVVNVNLLDFNLSGGPAQTVAGPGYFRAEASYFDLNQDTKVSDDERDEDADGLTNYDEAHGRMTPGYWSSCYEKETPFHIPFAGTDLVDPDSDNDGVRDGADDQDRDNVPNVMELSRNSANGRTSDIEQVCQAREGLDEKTAISTPQHGYRNPFNPCLPDLDSVTCPVLVGDWAPYGKTTPNYFTLQ